MQIEGGRQDGGAFGIGMKDEHVPHEGIREVMREVW